MSSLIVDKPDKMDVGDARRGCEGGDYVAAVRGYGDARYMGLGATVAGYRRRADIDHHAAVGAGAVGEPSTLTFSAIGRQAYLQRVHLVGLPCRTSRNDCCRRTCTVVWCSTAAAAVSHSAGSAGIQAFDGADLQAAPHRCRTRCCFLHWPVGTPRFSVVLIRRRNDREGGATRATPDSPPMAAQLSRRYGGVSRR